MVRPPYGVSPVILRALGRRVEALRLHRGWSQSHLALAAGLTQRGVSFTEAGKREPMASTLFALAEALGTTPEYLWSGDGGPSA